MKVCANCGTKMDYDDVFCPMCGTEYTEPDTEICEKCGAPLEEDASFCMICGAPVKMQKALDSSYVQTKASVPERSVPKRTGKTSGAAGKGKRLKAAAAAAGAVYGGELPAAYPVPGRLRGEADDAAVTERTSFYIVDFVKSLVRSHNVPVMIYLILNILVIWGIFFVMFGGNVLYSILGAIVCYLISVTIALSPFGENLLRWQTGCGRIGRQEILDKIEPLFWEARNRAVLEAGREGLSIPGDIELFMNDEECPNAFATGRRTICFTKGLLDLPEDQIIALQGHAEKTPQSHKISYGSPHGADIYSTELLLQLQILNPNLVSGKTYHIPGHVYPGRGIAVFHMGKCTPVDDPLPLPSFSPERTE